MGADGHTDDSWVTRGVYAVCFPAGSCERAVILCRRGGRSVWMHIPEQLRRQVVMYRCEVM